MASSLHVVQGLYGDTSILEYDNNGKSEFILVDGGPNKSYRYSRQSTVLDTTKNLFDLLTHLSGRTTRQLETINTLVVTHDDADHKNGIAQLFDYLITQKNSSPTKMEWALGLKLMKDKKPPIENIWYNSLEGLTAHYAENITPAERMQLVKDGFIDSKGIPVVGWLGIFRINYNVKMGREIKFNSEIVQPTPTTHPLFTTIGQHSRSRPITKGAITVDVLGPSIPWSKAVLRKLMDEVKNVSDFRTGDVLDAKQQNVNIDLKSTATQDSAPRNRSSIVLRANYKTNAGKSRAVLMLADAPMTKELRDQLFPTKDTEYALVKIAHHGSAHNNYLSELLVNPDIAGELAWVKLSTGSLLQKAFLYFLTLRAPKYVISASTQFGSSPNPHISTILGIYLAAAARHMRYVFNQDTSDPTKWKVEVYMTGILAPNAKAEIANFISNPEAYKDLIQSLDVFVLPGNRTTKVIDYIKDYNSHMKIWTLKEGQPYGSIGILDGSKGDNQWVEYKILANAQGSKGEYDGTHATGTLAPEVSDSEPYKPAPKL